MLEVIGVGFKHTSRVHPNSSMVYSYNGFYTIAITLFLACDESPTV